MILTQIHTKVLVIPEELKLGAKEALKSRLFVNGWTLGSTLRRVKEFPHEGEQIALAYVPDDSYQNPIGICYKNCLGCLHVFVRKKYRNNGIGSHLINMLFEEGCYGTEGIDPKGKIWLNNGVEFRKY